MLGDELCFVFFVFFWQGIKWLGWVGGFGWIGRIGKVMYRFHKKFSLFRFLIIIIPFSP